jgi:hypothetical protein
MVIPAKDDAPAGEPAGDGVASLTVRIDGKIRCFIALGDGSNVVRKGRVTPGYRWQFHFPTYQQLWAGGHLSGRMTFREVAGISDFDGPVYWKRAANPSASFYPRGFAVSRQAVGSKYLVPSAASSALPGLAAGGNNVQLVLGAGVGNAPSVPVLLSWSAADTIAPNLTVPRVNLKVNRKTGMIRGTYLDPSSRSLVDVDAAIFQKQSRCAGRFKGYGVTGYVSILPVAAPAP